MTNNQLKLAAQHLLTHNILRFWEEHMFDPQGGFFGRTLVASDSYAEYPILAPRATRLFMAPSMVIFLSFCVVQVVGLIFLSWVV